MKKILGIILISPIILLIILVVIAKPIILIALAILLSCALGMRLLEDERKK